MEHEYFMNEAVRLAVESVENGWGGPFGAVLVRDGRIVARGQNRVLLTGDPTAHAEVETLRKASQVLNPETPSVAQERQNDYHLSLEPRPEGSPDPLPERARMFAGCSIYVSGAPCPMCMSAIYWARLDAVYFACGFDDTSRIGFDDRFQYEDFARPLDRRRIPIRQVHRELGLKAYETWANKVDRHPY
jgi:tRNA(Arg) A34 adenosine deaminase TadA